MGIGFRLKEILRQRKMTIKQLSEKSGVSLNTLYSITKRDSDKVDPVILNKIASALDIPSDMICGSDFLEEKPSIRQEAKSLSGTFPNLDERSIENFYRFFSSIPESRLDEVFQCLHELADAFKQNPNLSKFEAQTQDGFFSAKLSIEFEKGKPPQD